MSPTVPSRRVLIVGSYPPVWTAGTAGTLAAVRRAIEAGDDPVVASPRPSAALYSVAVTGIWAGRRLRRLQEVSEARTVVICAERGFPVPSTFRLPVVGSRLQRRIVDELRAAAASFDAVTMVVAGDLGLPAPVDAALRSIAGEVIETPAGAAEPGVTVLGPDEADLAAKTSGAAGKVARRALAPLPAPARNALLAGARLGRRGLRRVAGASR